jgi:hypothetical protein
MTPLLWTDRNLSWLRQGSRVRALLHDSVGFAKTWLNATGDSSPPPRVDFSHFNVLLVAAPSERTGQHYIQVDSVFRMKPKSTIYVVVTETAPGRHCAVSDDGSRPLQTTTIPASTDDVAFIERSVVSDCSP